MIYKIFLVLLFSISLYGMQMSLQTITKLQEAESFQAMVVAYKPRLTLGERFANQLSNAVNYGYVIPKEEQDTNLLLATLTDKILYTRLINTKTLTAESLSMRLADMHEIRSILQLMQTSDQVNFDYIRHPEDILDSSFIVSRYNITDIQIALHKLFEERKNKRNKDVQ